jgi:hypothetical protein
VIDCECAVFSSVFFRGFFKAIWIRERDLSRFSIRTVFAILAPLPCRDLLLILYHKQKHIRLSVQSNQKSTGIVFNDHIMLLSVLSDISDECQHLVLLLSSYSSEFDRVIFQLAGLALRLFAIVTSLECTTLVILSTFSIAPMPTSLHARRLAIG